MKKVFRSLVLSLLLATAGSVANAQTAELQVIHNCADPVADSVDVYVDGLIAIDNFAFRNATGFLTLPAGVDIHVGIAPKTSTSVSDTLVNYTINLASGQRYVAIASGVLNPGSFAANPDGRATGFNLLVRDNIRDAAASSGEVDFIVLHGATDAPTVDVIPQSSATALVAGAAYTDITSYLTVPAAAYRLNITPAGDNSTIVASYNVDLSTLGGGAAVVFASGFLNPAANQNGPAFGLFAALPNGTVVEFSLNTNARVQVIHNAADPAAAVVDVYGNSDPLIPDFAFRTATPFIDVPAGVDITIGIAPGTSTSVNDTIPGLSTTVNLTAGQTYVVIANGVTAPGSFATNPDGRPINFGLFLKTTVRESATDGSNVDFFVLHGATDAPTVDVIPQSSAAPLVDNAAYGDITGYLSVPASQYFLNITPGSDNSTIVASYNVDLSSLGGGSAVVFASGFLDPAANQNGEAFGIYAALANGTVVAFPLNTNARVQVIHNSADPAAAVVDVYGNSNPLIPDFAFRTATPFIDVPAGVDITIGIAPGTSTSVNDTIPGLSTTVNLTAGQSYVVIANGVTAPASFAVNPDGRPTSFALYVKPAVREAGTDGGNVDFFAFHGATDAPTVDVIARGVATLVDDAAYGDFTGYLSVPAALYTLDVTPAAGSLVVASFAADLSTLGGGSAVVFASGFLDPTTNQNGEAFGLFAALANGTVVPFTNTTGIDESNIRFATGIFPNPANNRIQVGLQVKNAANAQVQVTDVTGRIVLNRQAYLVDNQLLSLDIDQLPGGVYNLTVIEGSSLQSAPFVIAR
ncbi:MAG: DUF4397 domain-containing protein [Bacteroidia bacterium]|nr:DUF4397 domain-containing protein [Bacteroidia bacterium]MBP7436558.1 DUF4397 domain-containing protein [Bacteroidia bacterium]MBP7728649.1 DUF4397 domain-containing protein [Bacteroidia bacterium]MBP7772482.1 DUF4397 domain-containing protein [Bacteroidia bacterium]HRU60099.1 DUF4397 domain-containing protein [Bacteroidia bacterium]